jgi:hypothetical protein
MSEIESENYSSDEEVDHQVNVPESSAELSVRRLDWVDEANLVAHRRYEERQQALRRFREQEEYTNRNCDNSVDEAIQRAVQDGSWTYVMFRYTLGATDPVKCIPQEYFDPVIGSIKTTLDEHIFQLCHVVDRGVCLEDLSSKGANKGKECLMHVHFHYRVAAYDYNYTSNHDHYNNPLLSEHNKTWKEKVNTKVRKAVYAAIRDRDRVNQLCRINSLADLNKRSCLKIKQSDDCIQDYRIVQYTQKFYKHYEARLQKKWMNRFSDRFCFGMNEGDVDRWRDAAGLVWAESLDHHIKLQEKKKDMDVNGWWADIYNHLDQLDEQPTRDKILEEVVNYYVRKCSRGFTAKEIIPRVKVYMANRGIENQHQRCLDELKDAWDRV